MARRKSEELTNQQEILAEVVDTRFPEPAIIANEEQLKDKVAEILKSLTYRERESIRLRYGIGDGYQYTLEEVGKLFKITRECIKQIESKGMNKLRHPTVARKLEGFLDTPQK